MSAGTKCDACATLIKSGERKGQWTACACPDTTPPTRPAVILDPFCGTGTVPAVAHVLGRHGIGIDLSADYLRLAEWRCNDPGLRAKVLRVDKPKAVPDGQLDIFGGEAA